MSQSCCSRAVSRDDREGGVCVQWQIVTGGCVTAVFFFFFFKFTIHSRRIERKKEKVPHRVFFVKRIISSVYGMLLSIALKKRPDTTN
jgi:hypothetical protein